MARTILIFGQPAAGKSYSIRTLKPSETFIIDADKKGALPWRGSTREYCAENKNIYSNNQLDKITLAIHRIDTDEACKGIKTVVVDGLNNAMMAEVLFYEEWYKSNNKFEKYDAVARKTVRLIDIAQNCRAGMNVVFTAHVETADPFSENDVDKLFTPGKYLKDKIKLESKFLYVFYAKSEEGNFFFETVPNRSTARTPHECFEPRIPNDLQAAIEQIDRYERGD